MLPHLSSTDFPLLTVHESVSISLTLGEDLHLRKVPGKSESGQFILLRILLLQASPANIVQRLGCSFSLEQK